MTPLDNLQKALNGRSGLMLPADTYSRLESRLLLLARRIGVPCISELVRKIKDRPETLIHCVVEAIISNEIRAFRDKTPFDHVNDGVRPELMRAGRRRLRIRWCLSLGAAQTMVGLPDSYKVCPTRRGVDLPNASSAAASGRAGGVKPMSTFGR
ncbi:hypothetical protein [Rhodopseudomonas palustris]|uniref:Uncharacterized protein n=1 Tax=Rhodopseudomonas palustris TaxID=1076 RepID=A0A418VH34_RHOPL|nr:hypothetical protein [Rhodopseudomonas palustris]RJF75467.1 hypothetical protein D4Q52_09830 [Rhodopseudomonas palustris]